jgi:hypothetical protein
MYLMDTTAITNIPYFIVIFLELLAVVWFYGYSQFLADVEDIVGSQIFGGRVTFKHYRVWLTFSWVYLSQVLIFLQIVWPMANLEKSLEHCEAEWCMGDVLYVMIPMLPTPSTAVYDIWNRRNGVTVWERLETLTVASEKWGPALLKDRYKWINTLYHGTLRTSFSEAGTSKSGHMPPEEMSTLATRPSKSSVSNLFLVKFMQRNRKVSVTDFFHESMEPSEEDITPDSATQKERPLRTANSTTNQTDQTGQPNNGHSESNL